MQRCGGLLKQPLLNQVQGRLAINAFNNIANAQSGTFWCGTLVNLDDDRHSVNFANSNPNAQEAGIPPIKLLLGAEDTRVSITQPGEHAPQEGIEFAA